MTSTPVFAHKSVLLPECIEGLSVKPDGIYADATLGGGGHSQAVLSLLRGGRLYGFDRDGDAIAAASRRLESFGAAFVPIRANFSEMANSLQALGVKQLDGVLFDLGVSSFQLDTPERGFSYMADAPLDMRMDGRDTLTAADVVNTYPETELRKILFEYGDEKFAPQIASAIVKRREIAPLRRTLELSEVIQSAIPTACARKEKQHPAKRSFQAIRMEVNAELQSVAAGVRAAVSMLAPGGRICVITFHSGEDRLVKRIFSDYSAGCTCPRDFPVCVCGKKPILRPVTKHPIVSGPQELAENPRARSAKLRVAERTEAEIY